MKIVRSLLLVAVTLTAATPEEDVKAADQKWATAVKNRDETGTSRW